MAEPRAGMDVLLVHPQHELHRRATGLYRRGLRYAPVTMPTLAALVPAGLGARVRVVDEMVEDLDYDAPADLVGVTCMTGTATRAYEIADRFRARGATVVLGGVHASLLPDEAALHADAVAVGYAERSWPRLLEDFARGSLARRYRDAGPPAAFVRPDRRHLRRGGYALPDTVERVRGCVHGCEYCVSRTLYPLPAPRGDQEVLDEIAALPGKLFTFLDPDVAGDPERALPFFRRLAGLGRWWTGCATVEVAGRPALLDAMAASGCKALLVGFESVNQQNLDGAGKAFVRVERFREVVRALHARGILVEGCFVFGFDADDASVFDRTAATATAAGIDLLHYTIYTPYPGTAPFARLEAEGRILTRDWSRYDGRHVTFTPRRMSAEELARGFRRAWDRTYGGAAILRRLAGRPLLPRAVALVPNLAVRRFQRRAAARGL